MSTFLIHDVVKRGISATITSKDGSLSTIDIPIWGIAVFGITGLVFVCLLLVSSYTYRDVIATLAMVESPTEVAVPTAAFSDESPDAPLLTQEEKSKTNLPEISVIKMPYVTSSLRRARRHLQARAGKTAILRGLACYAAYHILHTYLSAIIRAAVSNITGPHSMVVAEIGSAIILGPLNMAWTHIVISEPSSKMWLKRIPSLKTYRKVVGPTALAAFCKSLACFLPMMLYVQSDLDQYVLSGHRLAELSSSARKIVILKGLSVVAVGLFVVCGLVFPAVVTLTRVQASMLPETDEPIISFDRTFGGKVIPEIVGGSGRVGSVEAWRSFKSGDRWRLIKLLFKVMLMQIGLCIIFFGIFSTEMALIMGKSLRQTLMAM